VGASGNDYDLLSAPVCGNGSDADLSPPTTAGGDDSERLPPTTREKTRPKNRLYFAGKVTKKLFSTFLLKFAHTA